MEGLEVTYLTSLQGFLDLMVARNDSRVNGFPEGEGDSSLLPRVVLASGYATLGRFGGVKFFFWKFFLAQVSESIGIISFIFMHPVKQISD